MNRYPYLDGLRGLAILLVVFSHCGQRTDDAPKFKALASFGQFGVQLFFVVSAFTLCLSVAHMRRFGVRDYGAFLIRRFFRIAPLYHLAIPFYFLISALWIKVFTVTPHTRPDDYHWLDVGKNLTFVHGLFRAGNNTIVPGGWSIGSEFLFYTIFPLIFVAATRHRHRLWTIFAISCALAVSISNVATGAGLPWQGGNNSFEYFHILNQMPCFLFGLIYFFYREESSFKRAVLFLQLPAITALVYGYSAPWGWTTAPAAAGLVSVGLAISLERLAIPRILRRIGEVSFSMYLLHFVVLWILGPLHAYLSPLVHAPAATALAFFLLTGSLTYFAATLSNRWIELPFIAIGRRLASQLGSPAVR